MCSSAAWSLQRSPVEAEDGYAPGAAKDGDGGVSSSSCAFAAAEPLITGRQSPQPKCFAQFENIVAALAPDEQWVDPEFPPNADSLGHVHYEGDVEWRRASDIWSHPKFRAFDASCASDVCRGYEPDGWLLGAIAAVGNTPHLMQQVVGQRDETRRVFQFRLFHGHWVSVCVDDILPMTARGKLLLGQSDEVNLHHPPSAQPLTTCHHGTPYTIITTHQHQNPPAGHFL